MSPHSTSALPKVLLLTDRRLLAPGRDLVEQVAMAVAGGIGGVLVRERDLPAAERSALGERLADLLRARETSTAVLGWAAPAPASAALSSRAWPLLHLPSSEPAPSRRPRLLGRSCHGIEDLRRAAADGCDYVTLSPVAATSSKPGYGPCLGPDGLRALLERAAYQAVPVPPVLALGGVTPGNARSFVRAGAHGVAVMGGFMRTADPAALAAALCGEVAA